jgi:RecA/RadA recombinase
MPPSGPRALEALLHDLGPELRCAGALPRERAPRLPTGIPTLDALLRGGFPRGRLCEITGAASSGRSSLAIALARETTRAGEVAAWVDAADAFDPRSAAGAGVDLARVLWVRAPRLREALRCLERLLAARGFALVALDLADPRLDAGQTSRALSQGVCARLARAAAASGTTCLVLASRCVARGTSDLALALDPMPARFAGSPPLLEEHGSSLRVLRERGGAAERAASLRRFATVP